MEFSSWTLGIRWMGVWNSCTNWYWLSCWLLQGRESNKEVMTVRKYSFLLANSSHKSIRELYVLAKYGNFVLNIQKSNWFLKKKVICQNSSQTVLTSAIIWELFAKKSADRPNCHYSSVTFSTLRITMDLRRQHKNLSSS